MLIQELIITGNSRLFLINALDLSDEARIYKWIGETDTSVFTFNYFVNLLQSENFSSGELPNDTNYLLWIVKYLQNKLHADSLHDYYRIGLSKSAFTDMQFCNKNINYIKSDQTRKRLEAYNDYLHENYDKFKAIDYLESPFTETALKLWDLTENELVRTFLKKSDIPGKLSEIIRRFDFLQSIHLKDFGGVKPSILEEKALAKVFRRSEFIDLPFLQTSEERKQSYMQALKDWLVITLEERKKKLGRYASVYTPVEDFIALLDAEIGGKEVLEITAPKEVAPTKAEERHLTEAQQKLLTIFERIKDYELFDMMAQKATKAVHIVFLFRQMSEIEKPPKIVSRYKTFRDWFEEHYKDLGIVLNDKPQTYVMSKTEDRLLAYKTIKELFLKLKELDNK